MYEGKGNGQRVDRRGFLKGSALFAAAFGLAAIPAAAQEPQAPPAPSEQNKTDEGAKKDDQSEPKPRRRLIDKEGREYRVCDMCGGNMYKEDNIWNCEQCGFSFEE